MEIETRNNNPSDSLIFSDVNNVWIKVDMERQL